MKQPDTNLAKAIRELQNEVDQKITLLEALRKEYDPEDIDFYQYIKTQAWEEMRQKVFRRDGFQCVVCKEAKNLNVHHITYDNLGAEKESDLVTLCRDCHKKVHAGDTVENMIGIRQHDLLESEANLNSQWAEFAERRKEFAEQRKKFEIDRFMDKNTRKLYALAIALGDDYVNLDDELKIDSILLSDWNDLYGFTKHMNEGKPIEEYKWWKEPPIDVCTLPETLRGDRDLEDKKSLMKSYLYWLAKLSIDGAEHFYTLELRHEDVIRSKKRFDLMHELLRKNEMWK